MHFTIFSLSKFIILSLIVKSNAKGGSDYLTKSV